MKLGVCYYPEHWPETDWANDARMMKAMGLTHVRIGEFAWSRIEPDQGHYDWGWLDRAIDCLHGAGLEVTLGTPTATPPKWLVDAYPEILPHDQHGHPRRFGSRRHYCFSSPVYWRESARIVEAMAGRYGHHPAVTLWQTDNEYGHHGSDESFSPAAKEAFRLWLEQRYGEVERLNEAWGTVFWSQTYRSFAEIDPPAATVTEAHPSHRLDWRRFCSDQMCRYNEMQVAIIRERSPGRPVTHNFIGDFTRLDHAKIGRSLDIASWDSYPIGLLSEGPASHEKKQRWLTRGDPDFAGFNHDVFRACSPKWAVMEQQPGPVNWARYNPAPAKGMVRLWTWEALAHGAEFVSYFRWRQVPFAQEQMHAGLLAPDRTVQPVAGEIETTAIEIARLGPITQAKAEVAILLSYESLWQHEIQPQGNRSGPLRPARDLYTACRRLGLNVDIVFPDSELTGHRLVLLPAVTILDEALCEKLDRSGATVLATALAGARTVSGRLPHNLPPGPLERWTGVKVMSFESLPGFADFDVRIEDKSWKASTWRETIETDAELIAAFDDGSPAFVRRGRFHYLACWPGEDLACTIVSSLCAENGTPVIDLGPDLRMRSTARVRFAFNYGNTPIDLGGKGAPLEDRSYLLGGRMLAPSGVAAWPIRQ